IQQLSLAGAGSNLQVNGAIRHLAQPQMELQMNGSLALNDVARILDFKRIESGHLTFQGTGASQTASGRAFTGKVEERPGSHGAGNARWSDQKLDGNALASAQDLAFKRLVVSAQGAKFTGEAKVARYRDLKLDGKISRFPPAEVASHFIKAPFPPPFPWTGM